MYTPGMRDLLRRIDMRKSKGTRGSLFEGNENARLFFFSTERTSKRGSFALGKDSCSSCIGSEKR